MSSLNCPYCEIKEEARIKTIYESLKSMDGSGEAVDMKTYRMVHGIGPYWNQRWEIEKQYVYYELEHGDLKKITDWHMVFWSSNKEQCEKVFQKYLSEPQKS